MKILLFEISTTNPPTTQTPRNTGMHPILTKKKDIMSISTPNLIRKRRKREEDEKKKVEGRKMSETLRKWLD